MHPRTDRFPRASGLLRLARVLVGACGLLLLITALTRWSVLHGQDRPPAATPTSNSRPSVADPLKSPPGRDLTKFTPLQKQMYLGAQRGADWLARANRPDGRFVHGHLPALKGVLEGDHFLRQAGAAFALARAARFSGDERHAAVARQAVLTLLAETAVDPNDPKVRHTTLPSAIVNRLSAAGLLVLAIGELPAPADDLLEQAEQLCGYIRRQQQADGSLSHLDNPAVKPGVEDPDGVNVYAGQALYGLVRSQLHRPAAWKADAVRKALAYYRPWWRSHKTMSLVPWQTAAYTEAFLQTKEPAFAETVNEMNDWLVGLQYAQLDPRRPLWVGGFMSWADGKPATTEPQVGSAAYAESLAEACRVARQAGDVKRYERYRIGLERCLQFLNTLQYTEGNTLHFADWYRPTLVGGFYLSHQDGTLRIDYTQHAVCALVQYLAYVTD